MKRFWNLLAGTVLVLTVVGAASGAIVFDDKDAFLSVLIQPGFYLEDFATFTTPGPQGSSLDFGPTNEFSYTMSAPPSGLFVVSENMSTFEASEALVIDFTGSPVTAMGGNFWPTVSTGGDAVGIIEIWLSDGTNEVVTITNQDPRPFRGFVSYGDPFTSMSIKTNYTVDPIFPTVDNFYVGQVVPVPSAVLLGIIGLGYAGRRLRRRTA